MIELFERQKECIRTLSIQSDVTTSLYGGAAGGAKSFLGCYWQICRRLKYKETRGVIGRSELKTLKDTTLVTFFEVADMMGLKAGSDFVYNGQSYSITFENKSVIILKDLYAYPSDPNFDGLGSFEVMDGFVDEASQITQKCYSILKIRIRHRLNEFCRSCGNVGLDSGHIVLADDIGRPVKWKCSHCGNENGGHLPKLLLTCNPSRNFLYSDFYKPSVELKLTPDKAFIKSLPTDNPHLPPSYYDQFKDMSESDRKRLLEGDWDFDLSPDKIFEYDALLQMFSPAEPSGEMFLTCDPAGLGRDRTVIGIWKGLHLIKIHVFRHKYPHEVADILRQLASDNAIPLTKCVVDSDGLGIGVQGLLRCSMFLNGSSAVDKVHFANLKAQCYYKLADMVKMNKIHVIDQTHRLDIIKELDMIRNTTKNDQKKTVTSKDEISRVHGLSPDFADMIMMRMYFELHPNRGQYSWA